MGGCMKNNDKAVDVLNLSGYYNKFLDNLDNELSDVRKKALAAGNIDIAAANELHKRLAKTLTDEIYGRMLQSCHDHFNDKELDQLIGIFSAPAYRRWVEFENFFLKKELLNYIKQNLKRIIESLGAIIRDVHDKYVSPSPYRH